MPHARSVHVHMRVWVGLRLMKALEAASELNVERAPMQASLLVLVALLDLSSDFGRG